MMIEVDFRCQGNSVFILTSLVPRLGEEWWLADYPVEMKGAVVGKEVFCSFGKTIARVFLSP